MKYSSMDAGVRRMPFTSVATDLATGEPVFLRTGKVSLAVQASCAVPGLVAPVEIDGRLLGDGSLSDSLPVDAARLLGAEYVIGVDIFAFTLRRGWGALGMGFNALEIMVKHAGGDVSQTDCLIQPDLRARTYLRFSHSEELYRPGRDAALARIPAIRNDLGL